ncbi:MAG: DUF4345 domain-containing protein [Deltaproteobacteria bacterium]|nr:DUF4345 domain-containing protein [Deltaproteobacteria bacterium]
MTLHRVVLAVTGLVYLVIAVASLVVPDAMAAGLGYRLDNADAHNEYAAVYVGLWTATALIFAIAARRPDDRTLLLVCLLLVAGQVVGRTAGIALHGLPSARLLPSIVVEIVGTLVLGWLLRRASFTAAPGHGNR